MKYTLLTLLVLFMLAGCAKKAPPLDLSAYQKDITAWQQKRAKGISSETSWLTVCGLFWLKEGENKFGSDSSNAVILPKGKALPVAGSIWLEKGIARLDAKRESNVKVKDSLVTKMPHLFTDADSTGPTVINIGSVSFFVIKRADKIGIRVKDKENPNRLNFAGLDFFPINPNFRISAKYVPYIPPKKIPIATVINTVEQDSCPGALVFEYEGKSYRLDVVHEEGAGDELYVMFSDETSGKETYGAGRQLDTPLPDSNNNVIIDFNKAYNWPCDYTEFATCPIPPPQNHLGFRVEAGEKNYPGNKH
jgi:uncharacterized protein (DUF1684 family)